MSERPVLTVVRGRPTPEELAAVVVLLTGRPAAAAPPAPAPASRWADRASAVRRPLPHGAGAWRAALRP